jgi:protein-disulfide isomerase
MFSINLLVSRLSEGSKTTQMQQEINSIKSDEDVFKTLLKKQPHYEVSKTDSQIIFGKSDANLLITILTNPYCNPCARMHKRVEQLLKDTNDAICIQYIFSSFENSLDIINKYLCAVYLEKGKNIAMQLYNTWFEDGKILKEDFFKNISLDMTNSAVEKEFQAHKAWREKTKIMSTPTVLVNGYQLPENYKIEDIKYFVELEMDVH